MKKILIILILTGVDAGFSQGNWELVLPPSPTSNQIVSLHFADQTTGWAVGEYGTILKTTDAGYNWHIIEIPQLNYLYDVYFPTRTVGYAVGTDGFILKSIDAGESWVPQPIPFTNNLNRVRFRDEQVGWTIGEKGLILHTRDGGINWEQQTSNCRGSLNGMALVPDTNLVFVVGDEKTILTSSDDGQVWMKRAFSVHDSRRNYFSFKDTYFLDKKTGWICGTTDLGGILLKTITSGSTIFEADITQVNPKDFSSKKSTTGFLALQQIHFLDTRYGFCLVGYFDFETSDHFCIPFYTRHAGRIWSTEINGIRESHLNRGRLAYLNDNRIIATGYRGEFLSSSDKGATWEFADTGKRNYHYIFMGNQGNLIGIQRISNVEFQWNYSADYGQTWQALSSRFYSPQGEQLEGTQINLPRKIQNEPETLRAIIRKNTGVLGIFESKDFAQTWIQVDTCNYDNQYFYNPLFLSRDTLIAYQMYEKEVTPGKNQAELLITNSFDAGRTATTTSFLNVWNHQSTAYPFISKHHFFNGHTGFLVGSEGNIIKTTDTGRTWENIPVGVVEDLWDITFVNRQTGFVVGDFGRILKTTDGGQTWRKTDSGTQEDIYAIGFRNETEGWVGTETGLRYTRDGGETWQSVPQRYIHGAIREIEFDRDGTGYAYTNTFYGNEPWSVRPFGDVFMVVLKEGGVVIENTPAISPYQFTLSQNYPNPFNSTTHIRFSLPENASVSLKIYNIQGQLVRTLLDEVREPGEHAVVWDGTTNAGQLVASGVYFYRLTRNGEIRVRKLLVLN